MSHNQLIKRNFEIIQLLSSEASSRDSSPNRPASPASLGMIGDIRQITIQRSKKDYPGFTVMTIPVYIGSSNNYTLHHLGKILKIFVILQNEFFQSKM